MIHILLTSKKKYFGLFLFLFVACATPKISTDVEMKTLPTAFSESTDSLSASNAALVNWKQYFSDSILIDLIDTALVNNLDYLL